MRRQDLFMSFKWAVFVLLLAVCSTQAQNGTGMGGLLQSACTFSSDQSTTIITTDIRYPYQFLLTASTSNIQYNTKLADPDDALFQSTAAAFENEIQSQLIPLIQNPLPSQVVVALDVVVILFRRGDLGQQGVTVECVLSTNTDQLTAMFLTTQLKTVASTSTVYPNFASSVSSSVNYCLREVIMTQVGTVTWPTISGGMVADAVELCPAGTKYVNERSLGRRSCSQTSGSTGHAQWEPYMCINCGQIVIVDDALNVIYNEIVQNGSIVLDGVMRAAVVLNEKTDIEPAGFNSVAQIVEYVANLDRITTKHLDAILRLLSNLLQQDTEMFRLAETQSSTSTRIVQSLDTILGNTALVEPAFEYTSVQPNVAAAVINTADSLIQEEWISFGSVVGPVKNAPLNDGNIGLFSGRTFPSLPNTEAYVHIKVDGPVATDSASVRSMFVVYHNAKLFQSVISNVSTTSTIAGRLVTANVKTTQDAPPVSVITRFKPLDLKVTNTVCRSWDPSLNNGHGDWSAPACMLDNTETGDRVKCQCDRFAAFTIFADSDDTGGVNAASVNAFVRVGAVICMLCLLAAATLYLVIKELRSLRELQILTCFFLALAAFYLILTIGIDQSGTGCVMIGALLHYCLLASIGWLGIAWVHLYDQSRRKPLAITWFMMKVSTAVWGFPVPFVIITLIVDSNHYITPSQRCFLSSDPIYNLMFALILPMLLILLAMGVTLGFTARNIILDDDALPPDDEEGVPNTQTNQASKLWKMWQGCILYSVVIFITLLIMIFFIIMVNNPPGATESIFAFLAIVQGILIIGTFCVHHREVREKLKIKLGYMNGPDSRKFQPYWRTSDWKAKQTVLPEVEDPEEKSTNFYLDDTRRSSKLTNQGFDPTSVPLSSMEMQRMGQNGVNSHVNQAMIVEADCHEVQREEEDNV